MRRPIRRLSSLLLATSLSLVSCTPASTTIPPTPGAVPPGSTPPSHDAPATPPVTTRVVRGTVSLNGIGLAEASIVLSVAKDNRRLGTATTAADGSFTVELPDGIPVGTVVLATATKGATSLNAVFAAQVPTMSTMQLAATPVVLQELPLDLATTIVTKKLMPKLLETIVSDSGTPESQARIAGLTAEMDRLVTKTANALAEAQRDQRVQKALQTLQDEADVAAIESAANALTEFGSISGDFRSFVEQTQSATVENLKEGGPVIEPRRWQIGNLTVNPPKVTRTGADTLTVSYQGQTTPITTTAAALNAAASFAPVLGNANPQLHNTQPAPSGGGGGGTPAPTPGGPTITEITTTTGPSAGPLAGSTPVTIKGSGFGGVTSVTFGGEAAILLTISPTQLLVIAPAGAAAGPVDIVVTTPAGSVTATAAYTYLGAPVITELTPNMGPYAGNTTVTIKGSGFTGVTDVTFGVESVPFIFVSDSEITATSPAQNGGALAVKVTTPGGSISKPAAFSYVDVPAIPTLSSASGSVAGGDTIEITGSNFVNGHTTVTFGGTASATVTYIDTGKISVVVPPGTAGTVDVTVTTPGGTATAAGAYTYVIAVTSIDPTTGHMAGGTDVTIIGTGFTGATRVTIGYRDVYEFTVISDTVIKAKTPDNPQPFFGMWVMVETPSGVSPEDVAVLFTYHD